MTEKILQKRNRMFVTGSILVVFFAAVIGFIHVGVLYLFGIPILGLVIGIFLIWVGKAPLKEKVLATLIIVPLLAAMFSLSFYLNKAEPETFLIPKDYRGETVVFYDEECGQEPLIKNGRRIYLFSNDGVFITKFTKNRGYLDQKFFLISDDGRRTEIPEFRRQDFETEKREWLHSRLAAFGDLTKTTVGAFYAYGTETYHFSQNSFGYTITDYRYFDRDQKETWLERKQFTEIAVKLLRNVARTDEVA